jgi:hypothetical protein
MLCETAACPTVQAGRQRKLRDHALAALWKVGRSLFSSDYTHECNEKKLKEWSSIKPLFHSSHSS